MSTNQDKYGTNVSPISAFIIGELAIQDTPFPIEMCEQVDENGVVIGHRTLREEFSQEGKAMQYSADGILLVAGLRLRYLEAEKDAIEIALGDTLEYTFMGLEELDVFRTTDIWIGVPNV
ncbi:MAG: hypothetical protein U9Q38_02495 [Thermodesulfobacteriota bacterium]|nr:hypothetical protein [Thermodesulfobacteriota bacterium]